MASAACLVFYYSRTSSSPAACPCQCRGGAPVLRARRRRFRPAPLRASAASDQERLLADLREQTDPEAALRMLNSALAREDFAPSCAVYDEIIRKLGTAGAFDLMKGLVLEMRQEGHEVKLGVLQSFLESHARLQQFDGAVDLVLNQLDFFGIQANTVVYNHLLNVLVEGSKMKLLESVYNEMTTRGITPDVVTFNTLIKALCRAHQVRTAVLMLEEMPGHGVAPDETTFTTLMQGFIEEGSIEAALRVKAKMLEAGCSPTRVTVNVLINGYCKLGRVEDALGYIQQEIAEGFEPDKVTYNTFVHGMCQNGHVGHALKVMDLMLQEGHEPDVFTYNTVINCLSKNGELEEAKGILNQMVDRGCLPDTTTFNTLIVALCTQNRLEEALDLARNIKKAADILQTMTANGFEVDVVTYGTLINGLCKAGRTQVALKLLRGMRFKGMRPTPKAYNPVIQSLFKRNNLRDGISLFREMAEVGEPPDALTYKIVFRGLCRGGGPIKEAFDFLVEMVDKGYMPEFSSFRMLAEGLLNLDMDDYLISAIELVLEKGDFRESDVSAIKGYLKIRKFYDALATFGRLLEINNPQLLQYYQNHIRDIPKDCYLVIRMMLCDLDEFFALPFTDLVGTDQARTVASVLGVEDAYRQSGEAYGGKNGENKVGMEAGGNQLCGYLQELPILIFFPRDFILRQFLEPRKQRRHVSMLPHSNTFSLSLSDFC
ncbi:hypothetical protein EJB05_05913, partial [Eragrostis curvula]